MSLKKVKSAPKMYISDRQKINQVVKEVMTKISDIVGSTLGPSGRVCLIESEQDGIPNKNTKDGVTVFKALGANDAFEQLIIEQTRDAATRTASEAGDGPQPLWAKVLTPNGFIEMRDVKEGMVICGTNGTLQTVVGVFPKGEKEIYNVSFSEGQVVECCEDHLWTVTTNYGETKTLTTKQMMADFKQEQADGSVKYRYFTPKAEIEFSTRPDDLPVDPYLVGLLLGDGSLRDSGSIELSLGLKKEHVLDKIKLPSGMHLNKMEAHRNSIRVKIQGKTQDGTTIRDLISVVGLKNVDSYSKFIPQSYLTSSKASRLALFQGLLDTDGHINSRGLFEFSTVSEQLAKDFVFLARSLGKSLHITTLERKDGDGSYSRSPIHRITELKGYRYGDKIVDIKPSGKFTEMQCIKVSNPDHLYVTDNFVVTHNTTTATILASELTKNLLNYCDHDPKFSPQRIVRIIQATLKKHLLPLVQEQAIQIGAENKDLLRLVAKISANGDDDIASAVIEAFDSVGYGASSHVTIQELSGPGGYKVDLIDGYPIPMGYEESIGRFHTVFINDQSNLRTVLENPRFLLFDGTVNDLIKFKKVILDFAARFEAEGSDCQNLVFVSHGFSEAVLNELAVNFSTEGTINVFPLVTPMNSVVNSRLNFLLDLSAFTGARVFGLKDPVTEATVDDLGEGMERFESYRFRSTVVGNSIPENIEERAAVLKKQLEAPESEYAKRDLEERLGKLTNGIAMIKIYAGSAGELKERHDRVEDAVMAVRAAITNGALPGGGRTLINLAVKLASLTDVSEQERVVWDNILIPSLMSPVYRLFDNAGYNEEEKQNILQKLFADPNLVYDVENQKMGKAEELGLFDATKAVEEALKNSVSIASVMGVMGGIICFPRDGELERQEAKAEAHFRRNLKHAKNLRNPANERA